MYEIELKAHVADRDEVRSALADFAQAQGVIDKDDTYYRIADKAGSDKARITCRIRRETHHTLDGKVKMDVLFTYKKKDLVQDGEGAAIEVNDEKECRMDDSEVVEAMLLYAGFSVSHTKQKRAVGFLCSTECGEAHIELCTVPPLGDFLEIEIMSEKNDAATVSHIHCVIKAIFTKCGIPLEAIEERYYTDMLDEAAKRSAV